MQLYSGHIGLNKHLHHIKHSNTPTCPNCDENVDKTIHHYLFECTHYCRERSIKLRQHSLKLSYLLSNTEAILLLLKFIQATG